ncbi:MAG: NUDIX hydrolase, partial [Sphingomonas sp.]
PELLMVERAAAMRFAGGALVFPGGSVDPGDHALAATFEGDRDDMAARIAAIRETLEEAGVAVGLDIPSHAIPELARAVYAGEPLGGLIEAAGAVLRPEQLVPFTRWMPRGVHHKVFDTRFYLARAPADAEPVVDGSENVRAFWMSARDVLAEADAERARIIFPTRRNLERLALFECWADAVANALAHEPRTITPWVERRGDGDFLCIPDDLGYPVTAQPYASAMRG